MAGPTQYRERLVNMAAGEAPSPIAVVDLLVRDALDRGASDAHIDPSASELRVRLRVDGMLEDAYPLPIAFHHGLIARLKILAGLRTDERQKPHDGRFAFEPEVGRSVDVRLSIMPTHYGENAVLRFLAGSAREYGLASLGLTDECQRALDEALSRTNGLILVTGPTGSGKTTTLYAVLRELAGMPRSLVTIEDPIEQVLQNVTQIPILPHTGLTFSRALRAVLRQDPDVMLVGEVRDTETARLATEAALTGHLVLSTLHTASAEGAIPRLIDMGVEPYLAADTVSLVLAQRLVRRLCDECRTESEPATRDRMAWRSLFGDTMPLPSALPQPAGCAACNGSGYRGRIALFEVRRPRAADEGASLLLDGYEKLSSGHTTLDELARTCHAHA